MQGRSYSSVCGRVRGHGFGEGFYSAITSNCSLHEPYVDGVSHTHGPAGKRRHIWTFVAAYSDDGANLRYNCPCSNFNINWTHAVPSYVEQDYFCDSNAQFRKEYGHVSDEDDDLWDGQRCGPTSTCCEFNNPPYFCKHVTYDTSEDMEIRVIVYNYVTPTVSLIEIFIK